MVLISLAQSDQQTGVGLLLLLLQKYNLLVTYL